MNIDNLIKNYKSKEDLGHSTLYKRSDNIIVSVASDNHTYTIADILENYNVIKRFAGQNKAFILNIVGKYTSVEPEVREFASKGPHADYVDTEVFVINSVAQKLLANFYFKINKPIVRTMFFNKPCEAEKWLIDIKSKSKLLRSDSDTTENV